MFRYSGKKSAIIIAGMVILLCFVSVTGATLALFTSNEGDGKIGINTTSGNLKVDIVDCVDISHSLVGEVLEFVTTSANRRALFEPGTTFYTNGFRVKNTGNISLNYILYISEDETVSADFNDAFDVWVTKDPLNRTDAVKLQEFEGSLEPGECSDIYYLVVSMKETAGNEFQDRTFTGIGVTVCAVQGNGYID